MSLDVWTPLLTSNPSLRNKPATSQQSRTCWTFARGCEACAAICCDCDLWKPITQDTKKIFCPPEKKSKAKNEKYNNDFRKVIASGWIPDALLDLYTSKYKRRRNKPNDGSWWKLAKCNNVHTSKQLRFVASTETINGNQDLWCVCTATRLMVC